MLVEIVIIAVAVFVLGVMLWGLLGLLLLPVFGKNMVTFCFSQGNGGELEVRARAYGWLRSEKQAGGRLVPDSVRRVWSATSRTRLCSKIERGSAKAESSFSG